MKPLHLTSRSEFRRVRTFFSPDDLVLRADGRIERMCQHEVGHPVGTMGRAWLPSDGVHGCDGCCKKWNKES